MCKKLGHLKSISIRQIWTNEAANFTPWLAEEENLQRLSDTLGIELELEAEERRVGNFRADILCRNTADNSRVLIENQLETTDHRHLGQILTYTAGVRAHTVVWIAEEFREEHLAALEYLNEISSRSFQFFGIEIKVWQIGDSDPAPYFDIAAKPNDWRREKQREVSNPLSETGLLFRTYWTELQDYMIRENAAVKCPKPQPARYLTFGIGRTGFSMVAILRTTQMLIGIWLYTSGENATAHFHLLKEQQEEIEAEIGEPLEWNELPDSERCRISLGMDDTDPTDEADWQNQHQWLASKLELFAKVFGDRIQELNAEDRETEI